MPLQEKAGGIEVTNDCVLFFSCSHGYQCDMHRICCDCFVIETSSTVSLCICVLFFLVIFVGVLLLSHCFLLSFSLLLSLIDLLILDNSRLV